MTFQDLLHQGGVPVPKIYGWIDELGAFVSEAVPGRPDFANLTEEQRDATVDDYVEALANIHSLPIEPFVEAGIMRASSPDRAALVGMDRFEELYRSQRDFPLLQEICSLESWQSCVHSSRGIASKSLTRSVDTGE